MNSGILAVQQRGILADSDLRLQFQPRARRELAGPGTGTSSETSSGKTTPPLGRHSYPEGGQSAAARKLSEVSFVVVTDTHLGYQKKMAAEQQWHGRADDTSQLMARFRGRGNKSTELKVVALFR